MNFSDLFPSEPSSAIKSIQRGDVGVSNSTTTNVTIAAVNPAKSFVLLNGGYGSSGNAGIPRLTAFTSTMITIAIANVSTNVSWQVVEYN